MTTYFHRETTLGPIKALSGGLQVDCVATVMRSMDRGVQSAQDIEFQVYNKTADHVAGMKPLIDAALQKGAELARAYIAARSGKVA